MFAVPHKKGRALDIVHLRRRFQSGSVLDTGDELAQITGKRKIVITDYTEKRGQIN